MCFLAISYNRINSARKQSQLRACEPIDSLVKSQYISTPFLQFSQKQLTLITKTVISTLYKHSKIIRKKQVEQLEPIKITKTQANYQSLLLDMMSKLVGEQVESNRLLRKMAGENDLEVSRANLLKSPSKPIFHVLQKSMPLSVNSPQKETEEECDRSEEASIICSNPFRYVPDCFKEKEEPSELQLLNEKTDKVVSSLEGLGEVLKRIQFCFASTAKQGDMMRSLKRTVTKQFQQRDVRSDSMENKENAQYIPDKMQAKKQQKPVEVKKEERQAQPKKDKYEDPLKDGFNFTDKKEKDLPKPAKKNKAKRQRQGGRISAFNTDKIETSLEQIRVIGKPQPVLCKQAEQKKNYSIVTHILPYSDKREMKIKISVEQVMEYYNLKLIKDEVQASTVAQHWLGCVYRSTASICWNLLSKHELSFDQTKILFTENIIYNIIEFMRTIKAQERVTGIKANRWGLVQNINATSVSILEYLCMQYPQTKVEDANIALRREIPNIDNKGEVEFDLISKVSQAKEVIFRRKESANYTQEIMKTINYMIERSNQEYPYFKDLFSQIFEEVFRPLHKRRTPVSADQAYAEKVRNYTKYTISQKINKNTPKYTDKQIQNGIFFVKSPSVLRVITKWVEELDEIIRNPEPLVKNTQNQFKDHSGLPLYLYAQIKNGLYKEIRRKQKDFEEKVRHIKQECYHMEVLLALENFIADDSQRHISREQTSVGKYCYYLKSAISSYICSELNEAIHFLLSLPEAVDETKIGITDHFYQEESKKDLLNLNLVHFKMFDLLRCKCISKESEIVYLIRRLNQMSNDPNNPFKIIRIKDRLRNGTRDILINAQLGKGLVCEIQLAVISNIDKKQEQLDQFNHFLYQLKRAKLGPISENAAIWSTLEQRAGYYEGIIGKQEKEVKHSEQPRHPCMQIENSEANTGYAEKFTRPIICVSCKTFYEIPRTCLFNITCKRCRQTYCGQCHYANMKEAPRKEYIFERYFRPFFNHLQEYTDFNKPFPRFGFLIRKFYLKKQVFFFRVLHKGAEELAEKGRIGIEIIISVVQDGKVRNFAINQCPLQAEVRNGDLIITEARHRDEISKYIIFGIDMSKDLLEKKTGPLGEVFQCFNKEKLKYINLLRQPAYIEQIKMIKRSKQLKKEARQLRAVLSNQTLLTYLKLDKIVVLVQIETEEKALNQELVKVLNITKLRNYALQKSFAVSMDFRQMTDEMDIIRAGPKEFPKELYDNFCRRVTKFYINFGGIQSVTFLADFTKIRVLYLSSNCITSLQGIENLTMLEYVCFDKNNVSSLQPLANLTNLLQISGSENRIKSLDGLQGLSKMTILTLYKNEISQIKCLENMQLRELSLNNNPIQRLQNLSHMKGSLEELYIGGTKFNNFDGIYEFSGLRKLSLDSMNLRKIQPNLLKGLQALTHLSMADNQLDKIQNLQSQGSQLMQLNLKNNYIREISGLDGCSKLEILKLQHNFISNVAGIKSIQRLKVLYLEENPLQDCSDLYSTENNIELYFTKQEDSTNGDPLYAPKPCFYEKYENYQKERGASSSNNDQQVEDD